MPEAARPLQPPLTFRNGPRRQGCADAGAKRVRSSAQAAPPWTAPGPCQDILLIVGGGAPWRALPTVAPPGRGPTASKTQPDKPRANKSGQLDMLRTLGAVVSKHTCG
jgi:hypothetical protein